MSDDTNTAYPRSLIHELAEKVADQGGRIAKLEEHMAEVRPDVEEHDVRLAEHESAIEIMRSQLARFDKVVTRSALLTEGIAASMARVIAKLGA